MGERNRLQHLTFSIYLSPNCKYNILYVTTLQQCGLSWQIWLWCTKILSNTAIKMPYLMERFWSPNLGQCYTVLSVQLCPGPVLIVNKLLRSYRKSPVFLVWLLSALRCSFEQYSPKIGSLSKWCFCNKMFFFDQDFSQIKSLVSGSSWSGSLVSAAGGCCSLCRAVC